jgi:hypothetical protein
LLFDFIDCALRNVARGLRGFAECPEHFEVIRQRLANARVLNLYGHRLARLCHCVMHLSQRGGRERLSIELLEYFLRWRAETLLELNAHE